MKKAIATTAANICSFPPTDVASWLCQELGIYRDIWCLSFPIFLSWSTTRNNVSYVTRILYRFSFLLYSCTSFSLPVINHLLCEILIELCRVPIVPPITSLNKIVDINIIHSKYLNINSDTPFLGMNLPLQLEIILPCTVALINLQIYGIIYFSHPWLIDLKLNTNWICIGTIIQLSKPFPCIWNTRFQRWGVKN